MEFKLLANSIGSFSRKGVYGTDRTPRKLFPECHVVRVWGQGATHTQMTLETHGRHRESRMEVTKDQLSLESSGQTHSSTQVKTLFVHTRIKVCNIETGCGQLA